LDVVEVVEVVLGVRVPENGLQRWLQLRIRGRELKLVGP
jgi:hypothetical protein